MNTIAQLADVIGNRICEKADLKFRVKEVCYGVECILVILISIWFFLVIGWVLGSFKETLFITIGSILMKSVVGGPHLSGLSRCIGFSAVFIVGLAMLFKFNYLNFPWQLLIVLLVISIIVIFRYAPLLTPDKKFNEAQKILRCILATLMILVVISFNLVTPSFWITGFLIVNLFAIFNISPLGVALTNRVETFTAKKEVAE